MSYYKRANRLASQGWRDKNLESKGVKITIPKAPWDKESNNRDVATNNIVGRGKFKHTRQHLTPLLGDEM